jgi:uncharacterized protein (UPF0303 family)
MSNKADIAKITTQEQRLVFQSFTENDAFAIGSAIRQRADVENLPMVLDIALWDRKLFYCARPGTTSDNEDWVRRKINLTRRMHKSSYRVALELAENGKTLADRDLPSTEFAAAGGCFPVHVVGAGIIGTIAVSSLPQRQDHMIVVEEVARYLKIDIADVVLDPPVSN